MILRLKILFPHKIRTGLTAGLLLFLLMAGISPSASAQAQDPEFLRAQALENQGKLVEARAVYEALYRANPNDLYYWKFLLTCERTGDYPAMERLAAQRLKTRPGELSSMNYLSRAYHGQGETEKARGVLLESIGENWKDAGRVRNAANEFQFRNDLDGALDIYRTARIKTGNPEAFSMDVARLHAAQMRYAKAIEEYLKSMETSPASYAAVERILGMQFDAQTNMSDFIPPLEEYLAADPKSVKAGKLLSMLKMRLGEYEEACRAILNTAVPANVPAEVWNLAGRMEASGRPNEALLLYREYHLRFTTDPNSGKALLRAAAIRFESGDRTGAKRDYETLTAEYPGTPEASLASLRLIELDAADSADIIGRLQCLADSTADRAVAFEAYLLLGERNQKQGMTEEAARAFGKARLKARSREEIGDVASKSALLHFFTGKFDDMTYDIETAVTSVPEDDVSNDLLSLRVLYLRSSTEKERRDFGLYARGRYALFRGMDTEGLDSLAVAASDTASVVAPEAARVIGAFWRAEGETARALEWYDRAISAARDTTVLVEAMIEAADIYRNDLLDGDAARRLYVQALTAYPGSVFEAELRNRLRSIVEQ